MFAFPGHVGIGLIVAGLTGLNPWLLAIGSLLPDLDTIPYLFGVPYRKTHRTFTHSAFMPVLLSFFSPGLALGVFLHLVADILVYPGVKLFHPFSDKEYYVIRGKFKKYHDPKNFLGEAVRNGTFMTFELSFLVIGLLLI